ncbi:MAG: hypothetical protein Q7J98_11530 [Kiritimatiellia bacterium]|nr:hypothetical protein [Kiritimatiellia bacterium]
MSAANLQLARMAFGQLSAQDRIEFMREQSTLPAEVRADRLLRRGEVARRLGCTPRTVDALGRAGTLHRVRLPGRVRGAGFRESEIAALIGGAK